MKRIKREKEEQENASAHFWQEKIPERQQRTREEWLHLTSCCPSSAPHTQTHTHTHTHTHTQDDDDDDDDDAARYSTHTHYNDTTQDYRLFQLFSLVFPQAFTVLTHNQYFTLALPLAAADSTHTRTHTHTHTHTHIYIPSLQPAEEALVLLYMSSSQEPLFPFLFLSLLF